MVSKLLTGWCLMAACVVTHAVGVTMAARWLGRLQTRRWHVGRWIWAFIRIAGWMIIAHLIEIGAWGAIYVWQDALPDWPAALYYSAVTYTTTGYGDVVLPSDWRLVGAVESLTGILMCGWSTGFFFTVVTRMFPAHVERTDSV